MFKELNFKFSSGSGIDFWGSWLLVTALNGATLFVLVASVLLALRYVG